MRLFHRHGENRRIQVNISGYTAPIFTIFSPNERYLRAFSQYRPLYPIPQGMTWPKNWRISSNISGYTGLIFAIFSPHESSLRADVNI